MQLLLNDPRFVGDLIDHVHRSRWYLDESRLTQSDGWLDVAYYVELENGWSLACLVITSQRGEKWNLPMTFADGERPQSDVLGGYEMGHEELIWAMDATLSEPGRKVLAEMTLNSEIADTKPLAVEQSNTSFLVDGAKYVKIYRRLLSHPNRECRISAALGGVASSVVPVFLGAWQVGGYTGAFASQAVPESKDGWWWLVESLSDDSSGQLCLVERLGTGLAQLHYDLRSAFGTGRVLMVDLVKKMALRMESTEKELLNQIGISVSESVEKGEIETSLIHGDLHLAQILVNDSGVQFIDFEGEPLFGQEGEQGVEEVGSSIVEYDVAAMLRSLDYAFAIIGSRVSAEAAHTSDGWRLKKVAEHFMKAYAKQASYLGLRSLDGVLLDMSMVAKATYELRYEVSAQRGLEWIPKRFLAGTNTMLRRMI